MSHESWVNELQFGSVVFVWLTLRVANPCHRQDYLCMYFSTRVECLSCGYADSPGDEVDESGLAIFVCGSQQSHATAIKTIALGVSHFCPPPALDFEGRSNFISTVLNVSYSSICLHFSKTWVRIHMKLKSAFDLFLVFRCPFHKLLLLMQPKTHRPCSCYKCRFSRSLIALKRRHLTAWIFGTGCNNNNNNI